MDFILRFFIISALWTFIDVSLKEPIAEIFETDEDSASCLIAVILGGLIGYFYMPIIAFSFEQKTSYWIASICMILSSFIFNGIKTGQIYFF